MTYHYRGMVERWVKDGKRRRIVWREGYSATGPTGGVLHPWMTKAECRADAARDGERATFKRDA